jgi:hypothetical protein
LEEIYKGFANIFFLCEVRGLDIIDKDELKEWAKFWEWLGVATAPRILIHEIAPEKVYTISWDHFYDHHTHAGTELWRDYLKQIETAYAKCPKHRNVSRQLRRSVTLEGFAELIESKNGKLLQFFYDLLAKNWTHFKYNDMPKAEVYCPRTNCPRYTRSNEVSSFADYLLRQTAWIPTQTQIDGKPNIELRKPSHCWFVAPSEASIIRGLLSIPLTNPDQPEHRQFCRNIGMRFIEEAKLEDWIDLLQHLPEHYPNPNVVFLPGRRKGLPALVTFSRWIIERINNLLTSSNFRQQPLTKKIPLIAVEGDTLRYIFPPETAFFADDRYHSPRWRDYLPFVSMDDNWREAAKYLGLNFISNHVKDGYTPGRILEVESNSLEKRLRSALPFMLAIVNDQRGSATEDVARYLTNLKINVVDNLLVHRSLTIPPEKILSDSEAKVYLEKKTLRRIGSGGRAPRSGGLYVRQGSEKNYDIIAGPIAEYIDIPNLADAFVVLLDRGDSNGRIRFLATRNLTETHVEEMRRLLRQLGTNYDFDEDKILEEVGSAKLQQHLMAQLPGKLPGQPNNLDGITYRTAYTQQVQKPTDKPQSTPKKEEPIQLPKIDFNQIKVVNVDTSGIPLIEFDASDRNGSSRKGGSSGGTGRFHDWEEDQRLRDIW